VTSPQKDLLERLGDLGEEAIARLAEMPGMGRLAQLLVAMKDRLDDLQETVRRIPALEARVQELERQLEELKTKPAVTTPPPPVAEPGRTAT
jgi:hypothetical protein